MEPHGWAAVIMEDQVAEVAVLWVSEPQSPLHCGSWKVIIC